MDKKDNTDNGMELGARGMVEDLKPKTQNLKPDNIDNIDNNSQRTSPQPSAGQRTSYPKGE